MANNYTGRSNQRFAPPTSASFNNSQAGGGIGARTTQAPHTGQNMQGGFAQAPSRVADPAPWSRLGGLIATEDLAPLMEETPLFVKPPTKSIAVKPPTKPVAGTVAVSSEASTTAQQSSASNPGPPNSYNNVPRRALMDIPASNRAIKTTVQKNTIPSISITSPSNGNHGAGANQPIPNGDPASNHYAVKVALALYKEYVKKSHFGSFDLRMTWRDFVDPPPGSKAYNTIVKLKEDGRFAGIRDDVLERR